MANFSADEYSWAKNEVSSCTWSCRSVRSYKNILLQLKKNDNHIHNINKRGFSGFSFIHLKKFDEAAGKWEVFLSISVSIEKWMYIELEGKICLRNI